MGLLKLVLMMVPFLKDSILNNPELTMVIRRNRTAMGLLLVNLALFVLYLYTYNDARSKDFAVTAITHRRDQLDHELKETQDYYTRRLQDVDSLHQERLAAKDREIEFYRKRLDESKPPR